MSTHSGTNRLRPQRWGNVVILDWGWFYAEWWRVGGVRLRLGRATFYCKVGWSHV